MTTNSDNLCPKCGAELKNGACIKCEQETKIKEALKDNPVVVKALSDQFLKQIKDQTGYLSGRAYYNRAYAEKVRPLVDKMLEEKKPQKILFKDFPQWQPNTVRQKIYDAVKYLADYDTTPDKRYKRWELTVVKKILKDQYGNPAGLIFTAPLDDMEMNVKFYDPTPEDLNQIYTMPIVTPDWQQKVVDFVNNSEQKTLKITFKDDEKLGVEEMKFATNILTDGKIDAFKVLPNLIVAARIIMEGEEGGE